MSVSTIATSLDNFITLGTAGYADGVTITSAGTVAPTWDAFGPTGYYYAISLVSSADTLLNHGLVIGDVHRPNGEGDLAGGGVYLKAGYLYNSGSIFGGGPVVAEATGVEVEGGNLENSGLIMGGPGASTGPGGTGVILLAGTVDNTGTISGGTGDDVNPDDGIGGIGVKITNGVLSNSGLIEGGSSVGNPEHYGMAALNYAGILSNMATIVGVVRIGYETGIETKSATLLNTGVIWGDIFGYSGATSILNAGTITGGVTEGVRNSFVSGFVANSGIITGGVAERDAGTVANSGLIEAGSLGGTAISFGNGNATLILTPGEGLEGGVTATPSFENGQQTTINHTLVPVTIINSNELVLGPGSVAGSIDMGGSFAGFGTILIDPGALWTLGGELDELAAGQTITGMGIGDQLVLDDFSAASLRFLDGTGVVLGGGDGTTLDVTGNYVTSDFSYSSNGTQTVITMVDNAQCFCVGARIAVPGGEKLVEEIAAGDEVLTLHAGAKRVRWVGRRDYDGRFIGTNHLMLPVCFRAGALGRGMPARDLFVSPGHAMFFGGVLVPAWRLVNGDSVTQAEAVDRVEYFHIELDAHEVIFAEGAPVESYLDDGGRAQFQNFVGVECADVAPVFARVQDGAVLQAMQSRVGARAERMGCAERNPSYGVRGFVDKAGPVVSGWAQDILAPEVPVWLDVCLGGRRAKRVLANAYRADLRKAGMGSGCHGFEVKLPAGLRGAVTVRRAAGGAALAWSAAALAA